MPPGAHFTVAGYELAADRSYDPDTNLWVAALGAERVRVGLDPLGAETAGDIVAVSFTPVATRLARGEPLATIEAAKFVGPLATPVAGTVAAVNDEAAAAPASVSADPLGVWLVELADVDAGDLDRLVRGEDQISAWFEAAVERFRRGGAIAE
jgi:glycine cleavage system H protein